MLYSAGFFLFGIAIWRSSTFPGWAGFLMAASAPLVSGPFPVVDSVAGALLAPVGGGWIALSTLRGTPDQDRDRMPRARRFLATSGRFGREDLHPRI
jgi:hypothetical protein